MRPELPNSRKFSASRDVRALMSRRVEGCRSCCSRWKRCAESSCGLSAMAGANEIEEELVDAGVGAEFGVEGGSEEVAFADEDREAVAGGEGFDVGAGVRDAWGADEDHLEWAAFKFRRLGEDGGVDLASVGVALDGDVDGGEGGLRGVLDVLREEDRAGAGAEGWSGFYEGLQSVEEAVALEEFEEGGGFA